VVVYDSSGCCVDSSVDDYRPDSRLRVVLDGYVGAVPPPSSSQRRNVSTGRDVEDSKSLLGRRQRVAVESKGRCFVGKLKFAE